MVISGNLVYLKTFNEQHLKSSSYHKWLSDLDVVKYIGREELIDGVTYQEIKKYVHEIWQNDNTYFFAVHDYFTKDFIGTAKLSFFENNMMRAGIADVGLMVGNRNFWGKGIGTEIIRILSDYAFKKLHARKLTAGAISGNIAVIKAFKNSGYIEEGILKKQFYINDTFHDQILLATFNR